MKSSNAGMTFVEVMMAAGASTLLVLVVSSLMNYSSKSALNVQLQNNWLSLIQDIQANISNVSGAACSHALGALSPSNQAPFSTAGGAIATISLIDGTQLAPGSQPQSSTLPMSGFLINGNGLTYSVMNPQAPSIFWMLSSGTCTPYRGYLLLLTVSATKSQSLNSTNVAAGATGGVSFPPAAFAVNIYTDANNNFQGCYSPSDPQWTTNLCKLSAILSGPGAQGSLLAVSSRTQ